MAKYKIEFKLSAVKEIRKLPKRDLQRILEKIESLKSNPYPEGHVKLTSYDLYRIRSGNYRIIYQLKNNVLLVIVIKVAHRKDVYIL